MVTLHSGFLPDNLSGLPNKAPSNRLSNRGVSDSPSGSLRFLYHTTILQRSIAILQRSIGVTVGPHGVPGVWDHACG